MRNWLIANLFIMACSCLGQNVSYIVCDSLPEELYPNGIPDPGFILDENRKPIGWGYEISEGDYKILVKTGREYANYEASEVKCWFSEDTVIFWYKRPFKASQTKVFYDWDGRKLKYLGQISFDPCKDAIDHGEKELRLGNVREASLLYNQVDYPQGYINEATIAMHILGIAHYLADEAALISNYSEAVQMMQDGFLYHLNGSILKAGSLKEYNKFMKEHFAPGQGDSIGHWICDYALYLHKADSFDRALELNDYILMIYPSLLTPILQKADVLFDKKSEEEAWIHYDKYATILRQKGRESQIPSYVTERIKKLDSKKPKVIIDH